MLLLLVVGEDFFPKVDAGMMRLHVRVSTGTRIEQTERIVDRIEHSIRAVIPAGQLQSISDNVGLPLSYVLAFYQTDSIGPQDADILIQLARRHAPTRGIRGQDPRTLTQPLSRRAELLPGRRYHRPGAELRSAGDDQCSDQRDESGERLRYRHAPAPAPGKDPRNCRPAHRRTAGLSGLRGCGGSRPRPGDGHLDAGCRLQPAHFAKRQRLAATQLLARPKDRNQLSGDLADSSAYR